MKKSFFRLDAAVIVVPLEVAQQAVAVLLLLVAAWDELVEEPPFSW
jgi:hypothetical protein